jgi:hypothetical protein
MCESVDDFSTKDEGILFVSLDVAKYEGASGTTLRLRGRVQWFSQRGMEADVLNELLNAGQRNT